MSEILLSKEEIAIILKRRFKRCEVECVSFEITEITESNIGFLGRYFILKITYLLKNEESSEKFFIKSQIEFNKRSDMAKERNVFAKEIFFYDFLLKEFTKYGYNTSFAPECYYCIDNKLLVLENLVDKNYKLFKKFELYNLDQCKTGLNTLALFHGASMLYEEEMSRKLGRNFRLGVEYPNIFEENVFSYQREEDVGFVILNYCIKFSKYMIDQLPGDEQYKEEFKSRLELVDLLEVFTGHTSATTGRLRKACGHGDLWFNNIFFGNENFKGVKCCLVDFQIMRYFHPAFDVLMFLHLNTNHEFRNEHLTALLQFYYEHLSEVMRTHGSSISTIFPLADYQASIRLVQRAAMFAAMTCNSLVLMPQELITEVIEATDVNTSNSDLQLKITTKAFDTNKEFRNVLIENLQDLHASIFK